MIWNMRVSGDRSNEGTGRSHLTKVVRGLIWQTLETLDMLSPSTGQEVAASENSSNSLLILSITNRNKDLTGVSPGELLL